MNYHPKKFSFIIIRLECITSQPTAVWKNNTTSSIFQGAVKNISYDQSLKHNHAERTSFIGFMSFGTSVRSCRGRRWGHYSHQYFPPFSFSTFSAVTFSHRSSALLKQFIYWKLTWAPKNLGAHFPDPVVHFGAPWRPFWILQAVSGCPLRR